MNKVLIFGNSGSGKSTLAKTLCATEFLPHLDLDTIAWLPASPPKRKPISKAKQEIETFISQHKSWVIEGCYTDLLELAIHEATEIIFMNLPISECINNARNRPWEAHKYASKEAQDANLEMLIEWITQYTSRLDTFSQTAHETLFQNYSGPKTMVMNNDESSVRFKQANNDSNLIQS